MTINVLETGSLGLFLRQFFVGEEVASIESNNRVDSMLTLSGRLNLIDKLFSAPEVLVPRLPPLKGTTYKEVKNWGREIIH